ncbi:Metal-dependent hydrolase YbeY, involved in rRNA and/or ribosome maturation and assembly [Campylobacter lari]|uniref:rRNA maturation RNase YbeY n=1 Tax=Campylobacter lari TaxID=201 RepID=UPI000DF0E8A8|nr:rRNA maturation RNase YbeY [Campylobacter lari]EAK0847387.1 rRNA maturation RNase YbeY [Campylobacter lari]EAK0980274.1 rRNA maturation RNase YbeY [Campylobacter lari]MCR6542389.1 rRNA maturation RNase YbeY [Campylobacter lari]STA74045.1 Metal-dependent hydrolase YbeY, involved in rRNA and/or ribosome maturation and assembly [Campylobacter lari]
MIFCEEEMDISFLEKIAQKMSDQNIELVLVGEKTMHEINLNQRGVDKTTDVLSFPLVQNCENLLGSIVINLDEVSKKAIEYKHSEKEEMALLFIHAMLHLQGYDHEIDQGQMRQKEQEWIEYFKLPKSLIVRVQGE